MAKDQEEIFQLLINLESKDRNVRKKALKHIELVYLKGSADDNLPPPNAAFSILEQPLLKLFADTVESHRELAIEIYSTLLLTQDEVHESLEYLLPVVKSRLIREPSSDRSCESSEELKLSLLELLSKVVDICQGKINDYMGDIINIISNTLNDEYAEIIRRSCLCAAKLAKATSSRFHLQSESLIEPLALTITNRHSKVRCAVIYCIGDVIKFGNNASVNDVVSHFAQRLFDDSSNVRLAVVNVAATWLMALNDRYSYFHKLIPLLLTGIKDEYPEICKTALKSWLDVGTQYLEENKESMKDDIEFAQQLPTHYPENVVRPNLGCRVLVQRNVSKILPALGNDISDWADSTRFMAASLLYTLILNCEENITQHIQPCVSILIKASVDPVKEVVNTINDCCSLIGYFVSSDLYCQILLERLSSSGSGVSVGVLSVLCGILQTAPTLSDVNVKDISDALCRDELMFVHDIRFQSDIVGCLMALTHEHSDLCQPVSDNIFCINLSVMALTTSDDIRTKCDLVLSALSDACGKSRSDLAVTHFKQIIHTHIEPTYRHWTLHSNELHMFTQLLAVTDGGATHYLNLVLPIYKENVKPGKDAELRLKLYTALTQLILSAGRDCGNSAHIDEYLHELVSDLILYSCGGRAGKSEEAVRTMAASALWAVSTNQYIDTNKMLNLLEKILKSALNLLEDDSKTTRGITCKLIAHLIRQTGTHWPVDCFHLLYMPLIKRIDDRFDDVRLDAIKCLLEYAKCITTPSYQYDADLYREHMRAIYQGLLLYLDDTDSHVQTNVYDVLMVYGRILPRLLLDEIHGVKHKHREQNYCDDLIKHFKSLATV